MDLENHHHQQQQQQQQQYQNQQPNSGLLRFRSAPSSMFDTLDSERLFSRFISNNHDLDSLNFHDFEEKSVVAAAAVTGGDAVAVVGSQRNCGNEYSLPMNCRKELPPQYPRQSSATATSPVGVDGSYGVVNSMRTTTANLVRQNSSPAGFFSHLNAQNGYAAMRGVENFRAGNNRDLSPSVSRLGLLSQISEIGNECTGANSPEDVKFGSHDTRFYGSGFPVNSWTDSAEFMEEDEKLFCGTQNGDQRNRTRVLSHHLSLPKTSVEMAAMEKLMQFQDSVPCKIRAKRGCATHPRSIAERVRRTRISERMRKLQELVPNMDKQTNTADMLDLAVDYIKDLQRQFKTLSDTRAKCKCLSTQKSIPNRTV